MITSSIKVREAFNFKGVLPVLALVSLMGYVAWAVSYLQADEQNQHQKCTARGGHIATTDMNVKYCAIAGVPSPQ